MINTDIKGYFIQALYLFDETELRKYMRKFEDETMVTGLLYLDNYDEALESVEEVRRSLLTALVERTINKYFNDLDGLVKRYENDKYIVVMRRSSLNELKEKKVRYPRGRQDHQHRKRDGGHNQYGYRSRCWVVCEKLRVCENRDRPGFWPGRRSGRFKGRFEDSVFRRKNAGCGKEYESQSPRQGARAERVYEHEKKVVVMGHRLPDADSFGAAIGIYRAAKTLNKKSVHRHRQPDQLDHSADEYVPRQPGL